MRKDVSAITEGDWVLLQSAVLNRRVGHPWLVTKVWASQVALEQVDAAGAKLVKKAMRKTVAFVFTDEQSAHAVTDFDVEDHRQFMEEVNNLRVVHNQAFLEHLFKVAHPATPHPTNTPHP